MENLDDKSIFVRYVSLVKKERDKEKVKKAIASCGEWVKKYPEDKTILEACLTLLKDRGESEEEIKKAIQYTASWLKNHPDDDKIRSVFLGLVRDKGFFKEYIELALGDTEERMKNTGPHPLFQDYLPLVEKIAKTEIDVDIDIELVKQFGYDFIKSCKLEYNIRPIKDFADWLDREKFFDEAEQIYEKLLEIKTNPETMSAIRLSYGKKLLGAGTNPELSNDDERIEKLRRAEVTFREIIKPGVHRGHHMAYVFLFITVKEEGRENEAENELEQAKWWFPVNVKKKELILFSSLPPNSKFKNLLNRGIIPKEIENDFESRGNPLSRSATIKKIVRNRWEITDKSSNYPYYIVMIDVTKRGKTKEYKLNTYGNFHPGRIPYKIGGFYLEFNRYKEAKYWFEIAIKEEPEDFANWWRLGYAKMKLANTVEEKGFHKEAKDLFAEALSELETAWDIAPKPLQLPASKDIPDQIEECKKHLQDLEINKSH